MDDCFEIYDKIKSDTQTSVRQGDYFRLLLCLFLFVFVCLFVFIFFSERAARAGGGGGGGRCQTFSFFPCSADHERDWPPRTVVFFPGWQLMR